MGAGIISDCFPKEERGWVIAIYNLGPVFGPSLGAVVGGFITQYTTWRWAFWATSIFDGALIVLGLLVMEETSTRHPCEEKSEDVENGFDKLSSIEHTL